MKYDEVFILLHKAFIALSHYNNSIMGDSTIYENNSIYIFINHTISQDRRFYDNSQRMSIIVLLIYLIYVLGGIPSKNNFKTQCYIYSIIYMISKIIKFSVKIVYILFTGQRYLYNPCCNYISFLFPFSAAVQRKGKYIYCKK